MAMTGNINPWAAGAVVFDTRPFAAFYERQMLRKQAKDDALDNYFRDLNKNVTAAGMRTQDVPDLLEKNKQWHDYYQKNKAAIVNPKMDNGQAYSQYMALYQDQLGHVNQSKEEHKKKDELNKLRFNKDFSYVFDDPNIINDIALDDLPLNDPNRKRLDLASIAIPPKPIDVKELDAYNKYLTGGIPHDKVPGQTEDLGGFKTRTPIYVQYSPENQRVIGQHAMNAYDTDKRWRYEANKSFKELQSDPVLYERYNKLYKGLYGDDIDSPREAWVAKGILDNNMKATEYKEGKDDWGRMLAMEKIKHANARDLIRYRKSIDPNDTEMNNSWVENYLNNIISDAKADPKRAHDIYNGKGYNGRVHEIPQDSVIEKAFTRGAGKDARTPDKLYATDDGRILPVFYKYDTDAKGNSVLLKNKSGHPLIDEDYGGPLSMDQAKLALGYRGQTKKQLGETMSGSKGKPKTVKQNGHIYTLNEDTGEYE